MSVHMCYCPVCGHMDLGIPEKNNECIKCHKANYVKLECEEKYNLTTKDYDNSLFDKTRKLRKLIELHEQQAFEEEVRTNPLFDEEEYKLRVSKIPTQEQRVQRLLEKDRMKAKSSQSKQKTCQNCGSTELTPVRKNWSLLTGILTNKVDLICNKCGAKVK